MPHFMGMEKNRGRLKSTPVFLPHETFKNSGQNLTSTLTCQTGLPSQIERVGSNPLFAQNLTSELSLAKSYGFGLRCLKLAVSTWTHAVSTWTGSLYMDTGSLYLDSAHFFGLEINLKSWFEVLKIALFIGRLSWLASHWYILECYMIFIFYNGEITTKRKTQWEKMKDHFHFIH